MQKPKCDDPWTANAKAIQKGNPHVLTVNQHIFPSCCIARFANENCKVKVVEKSTNQYFLVSPDNPRFTLQRAWDQLTEDNCNRLYEFPYSKLTERLRVNGANDLLGEDSEVVSRMYLLWKFRSWLANNPQRDSQIFGVSSISNIEGKLTQGLGEQLEKLGAVVVEDSSPPTIPSRMLIWPQLQRYIDSSLVHFRGATWSVFTTISKEIVIPDRCPKEIVIPIEPDRFLAINSTTLNLSHDDSSKASLTLKDAAKEFWIGRP